ncbi:uncharacterized protein LOC111716439 [Eurytemora carolleeae]|uniref:uncharacterized protein LOC111716439 n=1 Tax=Eurytemora carolleeae TaxID=1294199 RepID=UPI000C75BE56|nr:uncharacterized protein LOC111716439 [Eurytemora carolleeae]|eukprot:XP_023347664.1 uncharacterized protein LOC111716439 [Eurytemora affinis]
MKQFLKTAISFCLVLQGVHGACPFQTPFWFLSPPLLQPVLDEFGNTIPDRVWIQFGKVHNRKCVDFFRVEYTKSDKDGIEKVTSPRVFRHERGTEITVVPCTLYTFRVAAYEEFHGTGKKFPMYSDSVNFTLDYTPKFLRSPLIYEKFGQPRSRIVRDKRGIYPYTTTSTTPTTEPYIVITVSWDLSFIDFPICLAKVVFTYYNIEWEESSFTKEYADFKFGRTNAFAVSNKDLPCDPEFGFQTKVYGVNGKQEEKTNSKL